MWIIIVLFFISITLAFGMLSFRAWEIKTLQTEPLIDSEKIFPEIHFRKVERTALQLIKYIVQWIVLVFVKYFFIVYTKAKKWSIKNWPKVYDFSRKIFGYFSLKDNSFMKKFIMELKVKIRNIKEKVKKEHEDKPL